MSDFVINFLSDILADADLDVMLDLLNRDISLKSRFPNSFPNSNFVKLATGVFKINKSEITTPVILRNIKRKNKKLFNVIMKHPNGTSWLDRQVKDILSIYF